MGRGKPLCCALQFEQGFINGILLARALRQPIVADAGLETLDQSGMLHNKMFWTEQRGSSVVDSD